MERTWKKPKLLRQGDEIAIISLSSGMLGEEFCAHSRVIGERRLLQLGLKPVYTPNSLKGIKYLSDKPEKRAQDLVDAFENPNIKGIICAIGGDDTYRTLPYLMENNRFAELVHNNPKVFLGFSDTTVNHFMFYKLGLQTFYGQAFLPDIAELGPRMLSYTKSAFLHLLHWERSYEILPADTWFEERNDFSQKAVDTLPVERKEKRGYELLQGNDVFQGELLGGCLESMYEMVSPGRHKDQVEVCSKYHIFPHKDLWKGKILFLETSEEKPTPKYVREALLKFGEMGIFDELSGILIGKPQDEEYYEEYKKAIREGVDKESLPILYNVNFGHALPRAILPYGALGKVYGREQRIEVFLDT